MPFEKLTNITVRRSIFAVILMTFVLVFASPCSGQDDEDSESDDLFLFKPDTPTRQVRGAILAERLDRPAIAQGYLTALMNSQPSAETLMALRQEYGIGTFLKLSATTELQPASRELLKLINEASIQEAPSASTVELLIDELGQSPQQTKDAALRILSAENEAVAPLLNADVSTPQGEVAAQLLKKYCRRFRFGLLNSLPDADEAGQSRIIRLLGMSGDPDLALELQKYKFADAANVAATATAAIRRLANGTEQPSTPTDAAELLMNESVRLITNVGKPYRSVDDELNDRTLRSRMYSNPGGSEAGEDSPIFGAASLARAAALMRDATLLSPDNAELLAGQLVAEVTEQSWPAKWPDQFNIAEGDGSEAQAASEVDVLAMQLALRTGNSTSMFALLQKVDTAKAVFQASPALQRSYLLSADPKVRFLTAVIARSAGSHSGLVTNAIAAAAAGRETAEAVVIDSRVGESASGAAVLKELKYSATATNTGQTGFDAATNQLHCELILVHSNCLRWSLSHTISNLRADYRTRNTPIVIYGPQRDEVNTLTIRNRFQGIWFIPQPLSELTFEDRVRILGIAGPTLDATERKQIVRFARELP